VSARTEDLQKAIESLNRVDQERRRLIAEGNALLEDERKRIATEIHDDLNASLIVLKLESHQIASLVQELEPTETSKELASIAQRISGMSARVYDSARSIIKQLRPEVIDTLGLEGALQELVRTYDLAHPECEFSFRIEGGFPRLGPDLSIAVYRVVQEALSNIVKHANASRATVELHSDHGAHRITIRDDGKGFDTEQPTSAGIGLISMRERMHGAGGSVSVRSRRDVGTEVIISLARTNEG
jgi:two-component system sensor histidine kinase UhpB